MKKEILFGLAGIVIGAAITGIVAINNKNDTKKDNSMTMSSMVGGLKGKTGDELDKAFLSGMIEHHQGAVDMANLVKDTAKHDEIKQMAGDIISTQTNEIEQMEQWQKEWGYSSSTINSMSH